ncbi:hypothetical protein [Klebsiella aerogenes]|uniref:hypothetical protein n=1 Tax=Klebsiella aerogenes TaxID=548 RepID=UPI002FFBD761
MRFLGNKEKPVPPERKKRHAPDADTGTEPDMPDVSLPLLLGVALLFVVVVLVLEMLKAAPS